MLPTVPRFGEGHPTAVEILRGRAADPLAAMPAEMRPGHRLWVYTNLHCNLACGYCCVGSSPRTAKRVIGVDEFAELVDAGVAAGVKELFITGGEPFLLLDLDERLAYASAFLPTTVLTNGIVWSGERARRLAAMPREGLTLQVSLDSATPQGHDRHRGTHSFGRALDGIRRALDLGFRVRLAATLGLDTAAEEASFVGLCDELGLAADRRVVRSIARQGAANGGLVLSRASLLPELCVTAEGVWWDPVGAIDPTMEGRRYVAPAARRAREHVPVCLSKGESVDKTTDRIDSIDSKVARWGPTTLRLVAALLWISNVSWKVPPDFGEVGDRCSGLCGYVQAGVEHPVLPGSSWIFEQIVQPQLGWFGYLVLFTEAALAATLLSGRFLRVAAIVGMVQAAGIGLAVANAEGEWYWSYGLMIALHLAILISAPVLRPTRARAMAGVTVGYGVVVALAHLSGGITGDGSFTLFEQRNDFPGDFGRNVFPGSIGLGLVFVAVGVVLWFLSVAPAATRRSVGWAVVALAGILLATYGTDGLLIGLGSRAASAAVLAAIGLCLTVTGREGADADRGAVRGAGVDARQPDR